MDRATAEQLQQWMENLRTYDSDAFEADETDKSAQPRSEKRKEERARLQDPSIQEQDMAQAENGNRSPEQDSRTNRVRRGRGERTCICLRRNLLL